MIEVILIVNLKTLKVNGYLTFLGKCLIKTLTSSFSTFDKTKIKIKMSSCGTNRMKQHMKAEKSLSIKLV